ARGGTAHRHPSTTLDARAAAADSGTGGDDRASLPGERSSPSVERARAFAGARGCGLAPSATALPLAAAAGKRHPGGRAHRPLCDAGRSRGTVLAACALVLARLVPRPHAHTLFESGTR